MKKTVRIIFALCALLCAASVSAQTVIDNTISIDKDVHDFGDFDVAAGPVSCTFTVKNISNHNVLILNAVTSCGCTDADWTREPLKPGKTGTVSVTYKNEDGPYPFDKTVTVYFSDVKRPAVLHIRGSVHEVSMPLSETYPIKIGNLGLNNLEYKVGNLTQGANKKSGTITVANIGVEPLKVEFEDVSKSLDISIWPNPIPAKSTATISYVVSANRLLYGKNWYYATPVINGKKFKATGKMPAVEKVEGEEHYYSEPNSRLGIGKTEIGFWAVTKANFLGWPDEMKQAGPNPIFAKSTVSFGKVKAGAKTTVKFTYTNKGKDNSHFYKLDADCHNVVVTSMEDVPAGEKGEIVIDLDTSGMPKGANIIALNLFTNSPLRPVISLQLSGTIQ